MNPLKQMVLEEEKRREKAELDAYAAEQVAKGLREENAKLRELLGDLVGTADNFMESAEDDGDDMDEMAALLDESLSRAKRFLAGDDRDIGV